MRGVNKVIIVGQLGRDPEVNYTSGGKAIATLAIATEERWKSKETGEEQKETSWHRVKLFGRLAEIAGEYLTKGKQVYIEGKLKYGKYEKDGRDVYTTDIVGEELQMLGGNGGGQQGGNGGQRQQGGNRPQDRNTQLDQRQGGGNQGGYGGGRQGGGEAFDDEDIPFLQHQRWLLI